MSEPASEPPSEPWLIGTVSALVAGLVLALREAIGHLAKRGRAAREGLPIVEAPMAVSIEPKNALTFWDLQTNGFRVGRETKEEVVALRAEVTELSSKVGQLTEAMADLVAEVRKIKAARRRA